MLIQRQQLREKRKMLSTETVQAASEKVAALCVALPDFQQANHIAYYAAQENEIDPCFIFQIAKKQGKNAYFPVLNEDHLDFMLVEDTTLYTENKFGILEPRSHQRISPNELDIIFIPIVGFNAMGHRLGRGKGYYDRTLAGVNKPLLIGLAYEFQKIEKLERETWDIAMDNVITEITLYS